ncbi:MAG: hypothetical protein EOP67_15225, partial [Sphingomonas sp.]
MKTILGLVGATLLSTSAIAIPAAPTVPAGPASPVTVAPTTASAGALLPVHIGGRVNRTAKGFTRQWPGTYFEAAFGGPGVLLQIGEGDVILHV